MIRIGNPPPRAHEAALRRALAPMIAQVRATLPRVKSAGDVRALGAALRREWPDRRILAIVRGVGGKAQAHAARPWARLERAADRRRSRDDAVDGEALVERWSREAASKITSVRDEVAERLRRDVVAALELGVDPRELAEGWAKEGVPVKFGTLEGRMRVIAQHQLATLHAQAHAARARELGATAFIWRTQGDSRVRPAHRALDGTRWDYDDPPSEGLPGTPVNCRCWAETIIEDDLLAQFGPSLGRGE